MSETPEIEISVQAAAQLLKSSADGTQPCLLIDCRETNEYEHCRIEGAKLMPMNEVPSRLDEIQPHADQPIVVHCHHGGRSLRVVQHLRANGFPNAQNMTGGIDVWSQEIDDSVARY